MGVDATATSHDAREPGYPDRALRGHTWTSWIARREYRADAVAALVVLGYYIWLVFGRTSPQLKELGGTLWFAPLGLIVGCAQWRNASAVADSRTRLGWRLLACSSWSLWATGNLWSAVIFFDPSRASPHWINWAGLAFYLLNVAGCLALPSASARRSSGLRFAFDVGLLATGAVVLAVHYGVEQLLLARQDVSQITDVISTISNWITFTALAVAYLRSTGTTRVVLALTLASTVCGLVGDAVWEAMVRSSSYEIGDFVDGFWFGAWVLRWAAARYAWHQYRGPSRVETDAREQLAHENSYFPYVIVAGGFLSVLLEVLTGEMKFVGMSVIFATIMTGLLVARQVVELRENRRLFTAMRHQEARFRSLVQNSSDMMIVLREDGHVTYLSPSVSRVLGGGAKLKPGMMLADVVHLEDRGHLAQFLAHPLAGRLECRLDGGARGWRDVEIVASDLRNDSAVRGVVLNCRDVSERNELERQLRHSQKLEAVGLLAGGIAHDFNNLLGVIKGHAELMKDELAPESQAHDDAEQIIRAADRAAAVTRKILAFSRKQAAQPLIVDVNQVLWDLLPMLRQLQTSAEVKLDCQPELRHVRVDQVQLEQVIVNLATNARDAMPNGGTLTISTSHRTLRDEASGAPSMAPGDYVAISVADEGVGMSDDVRTRLFEPFFTTKPPGKGSGLGLAMAYGIVSEAGGGIVVDSAPARGTVVTVLLPSTLDIAAVPAVESEPRVPTAEPRTVLLVDDEDDVRAVTRRILDRSGFNVIDVADGFEALETASRKDLRIDLLLTDLVMPGMHGHDLIGRFRLLRPGVPIVCLTGFVGESDDRGDIGDGVVAVLSKPVSAEVLVRNLSTAGIAMSAPR
jgi:PAS domain S-box-containing protein